MITFALVAEGPTDQVVLDRLIGLTCKLCDVAEFDVNYLQPLRDSSDKSGADFGGWELVLEYCRLRLDDALASNSFVVIHLDTDAGDHENFGLCLTDGGSDRPVTSLIEDARRIVVSNIGEEKYELFKERIIFAISVHSIESWILLCLFNRDEPKSSFARLGRQLAKTNAPVLVKEARRYKALSRDIKARRVSEVFQMAGSLPVFLKDVGSALIGEFGNTPDAS